MLPAFSRLCPCRFGADAQGFIGGAQEGAARGNRAAGPVGGVVGGAIGAGVGTVNGALGLPAPGYRRGYERRRVYRYRDGRRYYR